MGIFSFGKKKDDDAPPRRGSRSGGTRAARGERVERRTRRAERPESDALLLDPTLPEKQRARRRLVGAIALVVAAVIVLPMVLDSHPKPVTDDIAIDIPNKPAPATRARNDDPVDTQAGVAPDSAPASGASEDDPIAKFADDASSTSAAKPAVAAPAAVNKPAQQQAAAKPAARPAAPKPPVAQIKPDDSADQAAAAAGASPSQPGGARFAVQLGAFANDASAREWATKLKAAGVPAYVERRKQADGSTLTLLRAGPFADRAAASAAIAKVRDAGLTQ